MNFTPFHHMYKHTCVCVSHISYIHVVHIKAQGQQFYCALDNILGSWSKSASKNTKKCQSLDTQALIGAGRGISSVCLSMCVFSICFCSTIGVQFYSHNSSAADNLPFNRNTFCQKHTSICIYVCKQSFIHIYLIIFYKLIWQAYI